MGKEESFTRLIKDNEGVIFKITTIYTENGQDQKIYTRRLYINYGSLMILFEMNPKLVPGCIVLH